MKRSHAILTIVAAMSTLLSSNANAAVEDEVQLRQMFCASKGGIDITSEGALLHVGKDVTAVVVCQIPGESASADVTAAKTEIAPMAACTPFSTVCGSLLPPSGSYTVSSSNPVFTTSCAAQLTVRSAGGQPTASGTSDFNCRGYNYNNSVLDCSIQWSGPTTFPVGSVGTASVNFNCRAYGSGTFGTAMNYSFQSPRANFTDGPTASSVSVTVQ
ncbi:Uncharacterised protein [Bordetella ansorpii]|uniref:Secreted protein n=1 Tax=Bordetella ansorpii TaxID=288768 RepID=A0A157QUX2_9BORD|nr:hypothetical protein [Bordetella ansorpii]SAI49581.1 Uncharacterised protein [Bordetella ansorpii]